MPKHLSSRRVVLPGIIVLGVLFVLLGMSFFSAAPQAQSRGLSFGSGLPVQLVDPGGRNRVEFIAYDAPLTATLQLYALSTSQFVTMYNSLPADYWEESHLDPTGLSLVAEWQETVTDTYRMRETLLPPDLASGFHLLTLGDGKDVYDELLVILSPDVLLLKASAIGDGTQVVAWASRLSTSEPLSGTVVSIYDDEGQLQASGVTDGDGVYVVEIPGADPQSLVAIGAADDGLTACGTRQEWNSTSDSWWYWWDWWSSPTSDTPSHKVYLYTDRPIYRPGHTVYYKGILRHDDDGDYTPITTTQPITVSVRDARDNVLSTATLFPSNFGTISGTFTLADETGLGEYNLETTIDDVAYRQPFKVEEYRKPDYEVTVNTPGDYYIWGDLITVTVAADYYFGQPVAGAAVQFAFYRHTSSVWQTTGMTDEQGRWVTVINTADYAYDDATYVFEATVSDDSNQIVSGECRVPVYYTEYGLTMSLDQYGYEPGETVTVTLLAQDHDGVPVVETPLTVTVQSWIDGAYQEITSTLGTTDKAGEARVAFNISQTGWYNLEAQGRDGRGRTVTAPGWFWVYRDGWGWGYDPDDELSISADKDSYVPGEAAQLLVRSPVTGTALLSLERGRVRQQYPVSLPDPVTLITLPIETDFSPNIFVTVNIFQPGWEPEDDWYGESTPEGRLLVASAELVVPATDKVLQVELLSDKTTYRPRETVTFTIQVQDQAGSPVVAEVSLGLVDEAIYALSDDLSADIHETFYGRRGNGVASYDTLHPKRYYGWTYEDGPQPTGTPAPPPNGGGKREEDETIRRDFPDTAYWHPGVVTDAKGQAIISLTLPDNLTRWRALARAVSLDTRVGETTAAITVTQELIVRPVLPRFLIQGDVARLRTIAHNYLSHAVTATMELSATGLVLLEQDCDAADCLPAPVSLVSGGTATADWSAVASELGEGSVLARMRTDVGGDAVELPLPIHPFAVPEVTGRVGRVEYEITETMYISTTAIPDATSLEIHLASSIALGLLDGLEYLISYPFG